MLKAAFIIAILVSSAVVPPARAEQRQGTGTSSSGTLCKTLYELYDLNMEAYYSRNRTQAQKQLAYDSAQRALSDFRRNGCRVRDLAK